jgi:hypothetical protein
MNLNDDQLQLIEEYAGFFLSYREIALMLDLDYELLLEEFRNEKSQAFIRFMKGKTNSKLELRKKVVPLAKLGSPQAQNLTEQYIREQEQENLYD